MFRLLTTALLVLLLSFLAGCQFVPAKKYSYVPPKAAADITCTNKCYYARKNCLQICELKHKRRCNCVTSFNTCYSACGGSVKERPYLDSLI